MPFTAEITFTGICGIVPRQDPPTDAGAFCIVLPNAWQTSPNPGDQVPSTIDGFSRLRRHSAFVRFTTHPEDDDLRQDVDGLWFLRGNRLKITPTPDGDVPDATWGNIEGLASFEDVVANPSLLSVANVVNDPTLTKLSDPTDPDSLLIPRLAAHIILRHGRLDSPLGNPLWIFDNFLRGIGKPATKRLNHKAIVTLDGLTSLKLERTDLEGSSTDRAVTFGEGTTGTVFITVANLCDVNPLQWGDIPAPSETPDDEDFRWHYEIVDSPEDLRKALDDVGSPRAPIPRLTTDHGGGNGLNCDTKRFPAVGFEI